MRRRTVRARSLGLLGVLAVGGLASCGTTMLSFQSVTGEVPPEAALARVKRVGRGTSQVDIRIQKMAPPRTIDARATHYVVWALTPARGDFPQNLGALNLDPRGTARFHCGVEDTALTLFITAESTSGAGKPTGEKLLWSTVAARGSERARVAWSAPAPTAR